MPKYEYACKSCGEHLEVSQSFTDAPLTECPACGGPLRKVFSAPAITFKGSGFYRTDNRKRRAGSEPKSDATTDSSSDTKTDTKAEPAKTESAPAGDSGSKPAESKPAQSKSAQSKSAQSKSAEAKSA